MSMVVRFWSSDGVGTATHGPSSVSVGGISPTGRPSGRIPGLSLRPFLETRSAEPTAAQFVWLVLREWPLKRY